MSVRVNDAPWRRIMRQVAEAEKLKAHVGVLASKGGNSQHSGGNMTLVELAATHEFGSSDGRVPERSFLRSTFLIHRAGVLKSMIGALVHAIVEGTIEVREAVGKLGAWGAAEVKNTITEIDIPPPLAHSTVDRKGSSKPLVDTGQLLNSITWEVVEED